MASSFHAVVAVSAFVCALGTGCASRRADARSKPQPLAGPSRTQLAIGTNDASPSLEARAMAHAHYAASVIYELNDERALALEELVRAAKADPADEELVLDVTRRLMRRKKNERALEILKAATEQPEAGGALFAQLARVYLQLDKPELAIEANRMAIRRSPRSLAGYQNLVVQYMREKQESEAWKVLESAAKQPGTDAPMLIELAELYMNYARQMPGQKSAANRQTLALLNRADALHPTNATVRLRLADGFFLLGENERAAQCYLDLLKHCADEPVMRDNIRARLAKLYLGERDRERASEQLEALVRENPTNPQIQFLLGTLAFEERRLEEAADCFRKAILLSPDLEPAYYELANVDLARDQPQEALQTLVRARRRFAATYLCEFLSALANVHLRDYAKAVSHFTAAEIMARNTQPERLNAMFYFQFGAAYERNGEFEPAEKCLQKSLELQPDSAETLNYLGYMWAERGVNLEGAQELIEKALKIEPESPAYLDSMGWVLFKLDQPREALTYLLQAVKFSEKPDATIYDHLGDVYAALGEPENAGEAWKKSLAQEANEQVRKKLEAAAAR